MIYLAIDPASTKNLGFAVKEDENLITYGTFHPVEPILSSIYDFIVELIEDHKPDILIVESSIGFGFAPTRSKIAENTGIIKLAAQQKNIIVEAINARHAFKIIIGKISQGEKKKNKTINYYKDKYNLPSIVEHEADALLLIDAFIVDKNTKDDNL